MYCPKCSTEYRESFSQCSECDVDLVHERPPKPEPQYAELVAVFGGGSNSAAVVRGFVEGAGIELWTREEGSHSVFPNLGPVEINVRVKDQASVLKALKTRTMGPVGRKAAAKQIQVSV